MTHTEREKGIITIAKFLGWKVVKSDAKYKMLANQSGSVNLYVYQFDYPSNWNTLIPVWVKFKSLDFKNSKVAKAVHKGSCRLLTKVLANGEPGDFFLELADAIEEIDKFLIK